LYIENDVQTVAYSYDSVPAGDSLRKGKEESHCAMTQ
jgi:hypothetical protein